MKEMFSISFLKNQILFLAICFCIFLMPSPALADEYWSETFALNGDFVELPTKDFDYFSFQIPPQTEVDLFQGGEWRPVEIDNEQDPNSESSELIDWNRGERGILRFSKNIPKYIAVDFSRIDSDSFSFGKLLASRAFIEDLPIFSRTDWGADESWRYNGKAEEKSNVEEREEGKILSPKEDLCSNVQKKYPDEYEMQRVQYSEAGENLIWPYQYSKRIRKIVIHHTAETGVKDGKTAIQVMRGIYRYHTVSRGWGDIGYHYIIAPNGEIFEGRAGGDFVVGGHVYCNNIGTIAIALMGNFNEDDPTDAQINALSQILPHLAKKYEIDLTDDEWFHGKETPNLLGHRDLGATACPGEKMYSLLPFLRKEISNSSEIRYTQSRRVDGKPNGVLPILKLKPGESKDIHLSFTNTGDVPWTNSVWLFSEAGSGVQTRSVSNSKQYVAAKQKEKQVLPGEVAHFTVSISAGYEGGLQTISFVPVVQDKRVKNAETLQVIEIEKPNWGGQLKEVRTEPKAPITGKSTSVSVDVQNIGDVRWKKDEIFLQVSVSGKKDSVKLPLKQTTSSGGIAIFTGRLPALYSLGETRLRMQLMRKGENLSIIFEKKIHIKESDNRAELEGFSEKVIFAKIGENYTKEIRFKNTGNGEWTKEELILETKLRRETINFAPQEDVIAPGQTATFLLDIPVKKGTHPYILMLKDGRYRLKAKVFVLRALAQISPEKAKITPSVSADKKNDQEKSLPKEKRSVDEKIIRIKLSFPKELSVAEILGEDSYEVRDEKGELVFPGKKDQEVKIEKLGKILQFRNKTSPVFRITPTSENGILQVKNWSRIPAWDKSGKYNDNRFSGVLEIRIENENLILINELAIGKYMLGVAETIEADHAEKKKALALVARSYAAFYQNAKNRKFPGKPYDGSDDPEEFQKYLGASLIDRSPKWKQAVTDTKNETLTFEGEIIKTPFHTCSGGKTISAKEKWGWDFAPYLVSVDDPGCAGKPQQGHGVGLSGGGAQYFAELGQTYKEILEYYYSETSIRKP